MGGAPEEFARKRDVLASHCADIGRDPEEIMLSSHIRLSPDHHNPDTKIDFGHAIEEAAALGKEGLDLAIVYLPTPHTPTVLEPLAEAIRDSGLSAAKTMGDNDNITVRQTKVTSRLFDVASRARIG